MAAKFTEKPPAGKKSEYLGNHTYTTEAGHVVEFDNTPGDRRIHIYHASGTFIEIQDSGIMITKVEGQTQEFNNKGKDQKVTGDFNISVTGNINLFATGNLTHEVKGNYEIVTHGDFTVKSKGNHLVEVGGDQRSQVNGKTSHRTSKDREEITGRTKTTTVNRDHNQSTGGDYNLNVSTDYILNTGNDTSIVAVNQIGMGSGDITSIVAQNQMQLGSVNGMIIKDNTAVQITSFGEYPSFIWNAGSGNAGLYAEAGGDVVMKSKLGKFRAGVKTTATLASEGNLTLNSLAEVKLKTGANITYNKAPIFEAGAADAVDTSGTNPAMPIPTGGA